MWPSLSALGAAPCSPSTRLVRPSRRSRASSSACARPSASAMTAAARRKRTSPGSAATSSRDREARHTAHPAPLLRDPPARGRVRHPHRSRDPRAQECQPHTDLHARAQPGAGGRAKPRGPALQMREAPVPCCVCRDRRTGYTATWCCRAPQPREPGSGLQVTGRTGRYASGADVLIRDRQRHPAAFAALHSSAYSETEL
jgi:hypothetical protein